MAMVAGVLVIAGLPVFFRWVGSRQGAFPPEPLLPRIGPWDASAPTFTVLYGTLLLVVFSIAGRPLLVLRGLFAYLLMVVLRMLSMALIILEPPPDIIPLVDPVTAIFYPDNTPFLKDLFFSGHTATLVLVALVAPRGPVRWLASLAALAVAALVLVQHVHWTVDVLAAIPAALLAWWLAGALLRRWGLRPRPGAV